MGSSWTKARTHVPCIGRRVLNDCTTREVPGMLFLSLGGHSGGVSGNSDIILQTLPQTACLTGKRVCWWGCICNATSLICAFWPLESDAIGLRNYPRTILATPGLYSSHMCLRYLWGLTLEWAGLLHCLAVWESLGHCSTLEFLV